MLRSHHARSTCGRELQAPPTGASAFSSLAGYEDLCPLVNALCTHEDRGCDGCGRTIHIGETCAVSAEDHEAATVLCFHCGYSLSLFVNPDDPWLGVFWNPFGGGDRPRHV